MPTTFRHPITQQQDSFFATVSAKWLTALLVCFCSAAVYYTLTATPTLEATLKVLLLTVPASLYMVYRSFVAQV